MTTEADLERDEDEPEGYIHLKKDKGVATPYFESRWEKCGPCYWVGGHTVYTLEDGTEVYDFETEEGFDGV
jgi:hypothetical protein